MTVLPDFTSVLSPQARVVTKDDGELFTELGLRWSDINRKTPAAVVLVETESDVVETVKLALQHHVPFVPKSGGHSSWSTIGPEGIIIDMSRLTRVSVDTDLLQVKMQGGVLIGQANRVCAEYDVYLPLGSSNTAGVIPMTLGGGLSALAPICGPPSDNIISARLVTASGELVELSDTSNPELLYALRGAGQFFGIVTELTMQGYPRTVLNTPDATVWTGVMLFARDQAESVFDAMKAISEDDSAAQSGLLVVSAPPPTNDVCVMFFPFFLGTADDAEAFYCPVTSLGPFHSTCGSIPYVNVNDGMAVFEAKGGFKQFSGVGLNEFRSGPLLEAISMVDGLVKAHSDAAPSGVAIEWTRAPTTRTPRPESTFSCKRDVKMWAEALTWFTEEALKDDVDHMASQFLDSVKSYGDAESKLTYQNWTRDVPIEQLYPGAERVERLKALKKKWDPQGIFTRYLL